MNNGSKQTVLGKLGILVLVPNICFTEGYSSYEDLSMQLHLLSLSLRPRRVGGVGGMWGGEKEGSRGSEGVGGQWKGRSGKEIGEVRGVEVEGADSFPPWPPELHCPLASLDPACVPIKSLCLKFTLFLVAMGHLFPAITLLTQNSR